MQRVAGLEQQGFLECIPFSIPRPELRAAARMAPCARGASMEHSSEHGGLCSASGTPSDTRSRPHRSLPGTSTTDLADGRTADGAGGRMCRRMTWRKHKSERTKQHPAPQPGAAGDRADPGTQPPTQTQISICHHDSAGILEMEGRMGWNGTMGRRDGMGRVRAWRCTKVPAPACRRLSLPPPSYVCMYQLSRSETRCESACIHTRQAVLLFHLPTPQPWFHDLGDYFARHTREEEGGGGGEGKERWKVERMWDGGDAAAG